MTQVGHNLQGNTTDCNRLIVLLGGLWVELVALIVIHWQAPVNLSLILPARLRCTNWRNEI